MATSPSESSQSGIDLEVTIANGMSLSVLDLSVDFMYMYQVSQQFTSLSGKPPFKSTWLMDLGSYSTLFFTLTLAFQTGYPLLHSVSVSPSIV